MGGRALLPEVTKGSMFLPTRLSTCLLQIQIQLTLVGLLDARHVYNHIYNNPVR